MALSGSVYTTKYTGDSGISIGLVLHWSAVSSQKDNTSTVRWELLSDGATAGRYWYTGNVSVVINSVIRATITEPFALYGGGTEVTRGELVVNHDAYGNAALDISVSAGIYEWGSVNCTGAQRFQLDTIARESGISAAAACIGDAAMIAISRKNAEFTHTVAYRFGELTGWIDADGRAAAQPVRLSATSLGFVLPETFYTQIPNAPEGSCTLTVRTYSGDTPIGAENSCSFTVTAKYDRCCPVLTAQVTDCNPVTLALTGHAGTLVRYRSTARCSVQAQARCAAALTRVTVNGETVTNTLDISGTESGSFLFRAVDSRGYETQQQCVLPLIAYIPLTANATAERTDPTGGSARLQLSGNYYNGSFGQQDNRLQVRFRVADGPWQSLTPAVSGHTYRAEGILTGLDYESTYTVYVEVSDALETVTRNVTVLPGVPVFDWGREDFCFHVPVQLDSHIAGMYIRTAASSALRLRVSGQQSILLFGGGVLGLAALTPEGGSWTGTAGVSITGGGGTLTLSAGTAATWVLLSSTPIALA